jgi:nitrite reductase/ring-hydroxylating ferredoxin subunit
MTIKQSLQGAGFKPHNNKAAELVASKFHSSLRNVRIVCRTGTNKNTGKTIGSKQTQFQAVYINKQGQWRTIASGSTFKGTARFASALIAIEVGAEDSATCKCGAKKFKAKSGNVVCADACWANKGWSKKKKSVGIKKNTSQPAKVSHSLSAARTKAAIAHARRLQAAADLDHEGIYTTFVPGQLVKVVEPQQDTLANFIGTVTKVERASNPSNSKLMNVSVMWMHSGDTSRHHNYRTTLESRTPSTYLVHA